MTREPPYHLTRIMEIVRHQGLLSVLGELEEIIVTEALMEAHGNCTQAAKTLHIKRTALIERRRRYGLPLRTQSKRKE